MDRTGKPPRPTRISSLIADARFHARASLSQPLRPQTPRDPRNLQVRQTAPSPKKTVMHNDHEEGQSENFIQRPTTAGPPVSSKSFVIANRPMSSKPTGKMSRVKEILEGFRNKCINPLEACDQLMALPVDKLKDNSDRILRYLSSTVDKYNDRPDVCAKLVSVFLAAECKEKALHSTVRLSYAISKNAKNDVLFEKEKLFPGLLRVVESELCGDIAVLAAGTIKNACSSSERNQRYLVESGAAASLASVLSSCTDSRTLIQVTAILRHMLSSADMESFSKQMNAFGVCGVLCDRILGQYGEEKDVAMNSCRVLAKATVMNCCVEEIVNTDNGIENIARVLIRHNSNMSLVIRVAFTLGNITYSSDKARSVFVSSKIRGAVIDLVCSLASESSVSSRNSFDAIIKLVRLLANVTINPDVCQNVCTQPHVVDSLIELLRENVPCLLELMKERTTNDEDNSSSRDERSKEELVLTVAYALNNLSYPAYNENVVRREGDRIIKTLLSTLWYDNPDLVSATCNVFGNLAQREEGCEYMRKNRVDEVLVILVDHSDSNIVRSVCGVLVNLCSSPDNRMAMTEAGLVGKLLEASNGYQNDDNVMSVILLVLHNLALPIDECNFCLSYTPSERDAVMHLGHFILHTRTSESEMFVVAHKLVDMMCKNL